MTREIKFRGKAWASIEELNEMQIPHENGWVFGALIPNDDDPYIVSQNIAESCEEYFYPEWWIGVNPTTVGQFTGHHDIYRREIYEGDIVEVKCGKSIICEVIWYSGQFALKAINESEGDYIGMGISELELQILGNKHDNPDTGGRQCKHLGGPKIPKVRVRR